MDNREKHYIIETKGHGENQIENEWETAHCKYLPCENVFQVNCTKNSPHVRCLWVMKFYCYGFIWCIWFSMNVLTAKHELWVILSLIKFWEFWNMFLSNIKLNFFFNASLLDWIECYGHNLGRDWCLGHRNYGRMQ